MRVLIAMVLGMLATTAEAQPRQSVLFQVNQTTTPGQSVFVLGSLPELGGDDVRYAVKLEPSQYPVWKATISLPAGRSYSYRYYLRNDNAGQGGNASNGTPFGAVLNGSTAANPGAPEGKTVFAHSALTPPTLWWRQGTGAYQSVTMYDVGPGRNESERRWAERGLGSSGRAIEFYLTNSDQTLRDPAVGTYSTPLDHALVQDGQVFNYVPAPAVQPLGKAFNPASAPTIVSAALGETRRYRVVLPRGYNQHTTKRYPVIYMHDGQNCFDASTSAFGVEWQADEAAAALVRSGSMRECIIVGVDNGPNRLNDYAAPDAGGWSNARYFTFLRTELKPLIDSTYRTLTDAANTGAVGSSMGAQASLYMGWDHGATYNKIGAFSGAWTVFNSGFFDRVRAQPKRPIRLYIDSGDAGAALDNYGLTYFSLRDNLINPARASGVGGAYTLELDLRHFTGFGQIHNEAAWASRLPRCFEFLFPTADEVNGLATLVSARRGDVNNDGREDQADLAALESGDGPNLDVDRDGAFDPVADRLELKSILGL